MSEFTSQPSADKAAEMLKKCCKDLFSSRNTSPPPYPPYPELAEPVLFKSFQIIHIWK